MVRQRTLGTRGDFVSGQKAGEGSQKDQTKNQRKSVPLSHSSTIRTKGVEDKRTKPFPKIVHQKWILAGAQKKTPAIKESRQIVVMRLNPLAALDPRLLVSYD